MIPVRFSGHVAPTLLGLSAVLVATALNAAQARFLSDDPLAREPETQNAASVREWKIDLFTDLALNLFSQPGDPASGVPAMDANTIGEVPDSSWFTNRILARPLSIEEAVRGPHTGPGPAPGAWTVISAKETGFSPGFTMTDTAGETWFVSFDADGYPEASTGAILVANHIFWALGYWQVDNVLTRIAPDGVVVGPKATFVPMSGTRRAMRAADLENVWRRAHRSHDGSYRAIAARALPGKPLGSFRYYGTRPDDPNDIIPHEHRRELRALKVFGAWSNLVDMKAGNTLDVLITEGGKSLVRHYLQDVGSTFGTGANGPREFDEGWEYLYEGDLVWKRLVTLGFLIKPWQTVPYRDVAAVGRFEGDAFDPVTWKPRVPTAALRHAQPEDLFWAARRVAAFSNEMINALAATAEYSDPAATRHLADVLIKRRDKIAAAYLPIMNPLVDFAMTAGGAVSFRNAAVAAHVATDPEGYRVSWARFDNATGATSPLGETTVGPDQPAQAPAALPATIGGFVEVSVNATASLYQSWSMPIRAWFRRGPNGWTLVGLQRTPQ